MENGGSDTMLPDLGFFLLGFISFPFILLGLLLIAARDDNPQDRHPSICDTRRII